MSGYDFPAIADALAMLLPADLPGPEFTGHTPHDELREQIAAVRSWRLPDPYAVATNVPELEAQLSGREAAISALAKTISAISHALYSEQSALQDRRRHLRAAFPAVLPEAPEDSYDEVPF